MTSSDTGRDLHPGIFVGAGSWQDGNGLSGSVVLEGRRGPIMLYRIRAMHVVPECQRAGPARGGKRLFDRTAPVGWRGRADESGVFAAVRTRADLGLADPRPAVERTGLKAAVGDAVAAGRGNGDRHCCAVLRAAFGTCYSDRI